MEDKTPILSVKNLSVNYEPSVLSKKDLDKFIQGEIVAVIGANGAGKSTMMSAIMGDVPRQAEIFCLTEKSLPSKVFRSLQQG